MMNEQKAESYAPGTHPSLPPPPLTTGWLGWVRGNLFSTPFQIILTCLVFWVVWNVLHGFLDWALFKAVFIAESRDQCWDIMRARSPDPANPELGACWAIIVERWQQFLYGFYPRDALWRPNLAFVLWIAALVPVLWDHCPQRGRLIWFSVAYPVIGYVLIFGAGILPEVRTDQLGGLLLTLIIGVTGITVSLPVGILLALGRRSDMPLIRVVCVCFIEFIRGVPLITLLFVASTMLNYFLPPGTTFDLLLRVVIMVSLFASAYMAEVIRGGLQAIPKGQFEAADALGLAYWKSMRLIVLPQALKISIPGIVNTFIGLFKDTTLVIIIGVLDLLGIGKANTSDPKWGGLQSEVYTFVAILFFIFCFAMSRYSLYLERKLDTGHKR